MVSLLNFEGRVKIGKEIKIHKSTIFLGLKYKNIVLEFESSHGDVLS